ncbi:squalene/phytoene synthase family protein [Flexivirga caeni]|nr:squalene/phytoene synthase family protein [Flexivirga caeni]
MIDVTPSRGVETTDSAPNASTENFPVALRILPAARRHALLAIYAVARAIDQLGDAAPGDRTAALAAFRSDLHRLGDGDTPAERVLRDLAPHAKRFALPLQCFDDLIEANLVDQTVTRYADFDALLGYCALSAHPIGRLVLAVFEQTTPARVAWSDSVCAALQVLEHCQDVVEDHAADRIYLPQNQLAAAGLTDTTMLRPANALALRRVVLDQVRTAREMLGAGTPLVAGLRGWGRVAVAGYVAGGLATADAIDRAGGDVVTGAPVRPSRTRMARHAIRLLVTARATARTPSRRP